MWMMMIMVILILVMILNMMTFVIDDDDDDDLVIDVPLQDWVALAEHHERAYLGELIINEYDEYHRQEQHQEHHKPPQDNPWKCT